jgi:hypothetical protein
MNERILGLLNEATFGLETDLSKQRTVTLNEIEKFAELIVKECLGDFKDRIARRYQGSVRDRDVAYGMEIVYSNIQDKFGVDE